ncbi:MAG: DUF3280 domain-containing protein [Geminicoccaceae bacterium]
MSWLRWRVIPLLLLAAVPARPASATLATERAAPLVAVFPLEVVDTSGEPPNAQWPARIATVTRLLAERLAASGQYRAVELQAADPDQPLYQCAACWRAPARTAGADTAAIAVVHKLSTLIAALHVWLIDVETQKLAWQGAVSLRGDTDEAWRRAMDYILRRGILSPEPGRQMLSSPFPGG